MRDPLLFSISNGVLYTVGWYLWIYYGSKGSLLGPLLFSLFSLGAQGTYLYRKNRAVFLQDLLLLLQTVCLGIVFEVVFLSFGWIRYVDHEGVFPPLWIFALYPLFSLLINHALRRVFQNIYLSFAVGAVGAYLTYSFGKSLGAALFPSWGWRISIGWGVLFIILYRIRESTEKIVLKSLDEKELNKNLRLLFDGSCPICSREINGIKKRNFYDSIEFVDISSGAYDPNKNGGIEKETAMQKIHAIDSSGKILTEVEVFYELYSRAKLPLLASLLKVPLFYPVFFVLYKLFAKFRFHFL